MTPIAYKVTEGLVQAFEPGDLLDIAVSLIVTVNQNKPLRNQLTAGKQKNLSQLVQELKKIGAIRVAAIRDVELFVTATVADDPEG